MVLIWPDFLHSSPRASGGSSDTRHGAVQKKTPQKTHYHSLQFLMSPPFNLLYTELIFTSTMWDLICDVRHS